MGHRQADRQTDRCHKLTLSRTPGTVGPASGLLPLTGSQPRWTSLGLSPCAQTHVNKREAAPGGEGRESERTHMSLGSGGLQTSKTPGVLT